MSDAPDNYWIVRLNVYAFDTKEVAAEYQDRLIDAFCAMPESSGYGSSCCHFKASEDPAYLAQAARIARLEAVLEELAAFKPTVFSGRAHDPQDDVDDLMPLAEFEAFQDDASAALTPEVTP